MAAILADDNFKRIFLNENMWISMNISLKFIPKGPIDNTAGLVEIIIWTSDVVVCWHIYMSLGLNELITIGQVKCWV